MTRRGRVAVAVLVLLAAGAGFFLGRSIAPRGMGSAAEDSGAADPAALRARNQELEREVADLKSRPEPVAVLHGPPSRPAAVEPKPAPEEGTGSVKEIPDETIHFGRIAPASDPRVFVGVWPEQVDPAVRKGLIALRELAKKDAEAAVRETRDLLSSSDPQQRAIGTAMLERATDREFIPLLDEQLSSREPPANAASLTAAKARLKDRMWTAMQMTGAPDTPIGGDLGTAWASKNPNMGEVWLELDYQQAVRIDQIRIHETFNPGAIARIYAKGPDGAWDLLWEGRGAKGGDLAWFDPPISRTRYATSSIRIVVDTDRVDGWNEIDAVELIGDGFRQWAKDARAQSSYADP